MLLNIDGSFVGEELSQHEEENWMKSTLGKDGLELVGIHIGGQNDSFDDKRNSLGIATFM